MNICHSFNFLKHQIKFRIIHEKYLLPPKKEQVGDIAKEKKIKIFCIGFGKTGTTSLEYALKKFGFKIGNQAVGEILLEDWYKRRSDRIINYCYTAQAFQDLPFFAPDIYKLLDNYFPNSKFILTIRDNSLQWYNSLVKFHSKRFTDGHRLPTEKDLANARYRYKGYVLESAKMFWEYPKYPLYHKATYIKKYENHNNEVIEYFKERENDFLLLNVSQTESYQKLARFLDIKVKQDEKFPWLNKT